MLRRLKAAIGQLPPCRSPTTNPHPVPLQDLGELLDDALRIERRAGLTPHVEHDLVGAAVVVARSGADRGRRGVYS
jgi:hypothetical protein